MLGTRDKDNSLLAVQLTIDLKPDVPGLSRIPHIYTSTNGQNHWLTLKYLFSCIKLSRNQGNYSLGHTTISSKMMCWILLT